MALSEKGLDLQKKMAEAFEKQAGQLPGATLTPDELNRMIEVLRKLERFWTGMVNYGGG